MKKNIKKLQIARHLTQLIAFFLAPALFILAFSELKDIYKMIISGNFNFYSALPNLVEFLVIILSTIILGRFFCGWICAFGAFNDLLFSISQKLFKKNFKVNEKLDYILKHLKYVVLIGIVIISWTMGSSIFKSASPWDAFAQITDFPEVLSSYLIGLILLVLITIGAFFIERFFCKYLCPLGAIFTIISKISIFKIKKPKSNCGKCNLCTAKCSMGLRLYNYDTIKDGDCINCLKCVEVCPQKNAKSTVVGKEIDSNLASSVAIVSFAALYAGAGAVSSSLIKDNISKNAPISAEDNGNHGFGHGNFKGDGNFKPHDHEHDFEEGTNLDSENSSKNEDSSSSSDNAKDSSKDNANNTSLSLPEGKYKDGTYTGEGTGFRGGTTKMSITIKSNKITAIKTVSNEDTPKFYERVEDTMIDEIISNQDTSVDTVSGATYSCNGIIDAVQDALSKAE